MGAEITFAVSSLGIVGMLSLKTIELHTGKELLLSKLSDRTNQYISRTYQKVRRFFSYFNKQNAILLLQFVIIRTVIAYRKSWMRVKLFVMSYPTAQRMHDMITGKGVIKRKGAVSFFLKRVAEEAIEAEDLAK